MEAEKVGAPIAARKVLTFLCAGDAQEEAPVLPKYATLFSQGFKDDLKFVVRLIKIALIVDIIVFSITFYVNKLIQD